MRPETLKAQWPAFERRILLALHTLGLDTLALQADHVALRVNSVEAADSLKLAFLTEGEIISENQINGRPILIIRLHQPLKLGDMSIGCIELPYPGNKLYPQEGWEHIELVLPCEAQNCEDLSQALISHLPSLAEVIAGDTHIKVKMSSPSGEMERLPNPTLAFGVDGVTVKVHPHSIESIISSEMASEKATEKMTKKTRETQ